MGRKSRKRKRKEKPLNLNQPKMKRVIWRIARYLTYLPNKNRKWENKLVRCPVCKKFYCLGFTGTDMYCENCYYKNGCNKQYEGERQCQKCQRSA